MKKNSIHVLPMAIFLGLSMISIESKAQIVYENDCLKINNPTNFSGFNVKVNVWDGFYWTCHNGSRFFHLDVSPLSPRLAGTGNRIVFFNSLTGIYNSIEVANVYNYSDARAKENIQPLAAGLNKILGLRPVSYSWKRNNSDMLKTVATKTDTLNTVSCGPEEDGALQYGFLAQEVEAVFPEAVKTNESGSKMINYTAMIPLLVQAIQELQATVEFQARKIEELASNGNMETLKADTKNKIVSCLPNPTTGNVEFKLMFDNSANSANLKICSLDGIEVKQLPVSTVTDIVFDNVSSLKAGVYIVFLIVDGKLCDSTRLIRE